MPDANPVLQAATSRAERSPLEGSGMAKDAADLATKVAGGDWTEGLVSLASLAYETKDFLADPLAKLVSMGLGWAVEFFSPLRAVLDQLVGDQEQLNLIVETWSGIADEMATAADDLHSHYTSDSANWSGPAVAQYQLYCAEQVDLYRAASATARSVANNARTSGLILTVVRELVRGLMTDAVGKAISIACRYPPPTTPAAAPEIAVMITDTSSQAAQWIQKLTRAFANAGDLFRQSQNLFQHIRRVLRTAERLSVRVRPAEVLSGVADVAAGAFRQTVKDIPGQLPEKIAVESAKGFTNTAMGATRDAEQGELYDRPGPHRVTGEL